MPSVIYVKKVKSTVKAQTPGLFAMSSARAVRTMGVGTCATGKKRLRGTSLGPVSLTFHKHQS